MKILICRSLLKQVSTTYLPHTIGPVSNSTELDINVLKFQNKKLANVSSRRFFRSSFSYCSKMFFHLNSFPTTSALSNVSEQRTNCERESISSKADRRKTMPSSTPSIATGINSTRTFAFSYSDSTLKLPTSRRARTRAR
jgi:hypothetical protein